MSCLPKPVLRRHCSRNGIKAIVGALSLGTVNGLLYHFLIAVPSQRRYDEFLTTYDAEKHYKELVRYGYLQSPNVGKE